MLVFSARRRDRCGICDEDIHEGDDATYVDDQICHAKCASEDDDFVEE